MKIISGGQTGADLAGLKIAKDLGFETGGFAPKDFKTSIGSQKELLESFGLKESEFGYKGRTKQNVEHSNATIRLSVDFNTPGEICTMNAINQYKKPWIDVDLLNPRPHDEVFEFLVLVKPAILNIAGNTQGTNDQDIQKMTYIYLREVLKKYKRIYIKG